MLVRCCLFIGFLSLNYKQLSMFIFILLLSAFQASVSSEMNNQKSVISMNLMENINLIPECSRCEFSLVYTDVLYGPNLGGENNNGAYLSIFGFNLGQPKDLGINTRVFINDIEVADYKYLGPSKGRKEIQQLSVQVGAITSGNITLVVNGHKNITDHKFTVQPGNMLYVSKNGSDSYGNINDINKPFRTLQDQRGAGVWKDRAGPGDFIVLRGGKWTDIGLNERFLRTKGNSGTKPTGEFNSGPITIMGYPGENVLIHSQKNGGIANRGSSYEAKWIVISNLRIKGGDNRVLDAPINLQWGSDDWRIVNNELFEWDAMDHDINKKRTEARAGGITGNGNNVKIFGNSIHDIGGGTKNHGIYIDYDGDPKTVENIEIAWNYIFKHLGGNIIQLYGSNGYITNVNIHHNRLDGGSRYGINIGQNSKSNIFVWNNVITNTSYAGLRTDTSNPQGLYIYNNTFHNVDNRNKSNGAITNDYEMKNAVFEFKNNIVVPSLKTTSYISQTSGWDAAIFENNLWYGLGLPPVYDISPVLRKNTSTEPGFVNIQKYDYHLTKKSIAIYKSVKTKIKIFTDFDNNIRRDGGRHDIGAYEFH